MTLSRPRRGGYAVAVRQIVAFWMLMAALFPAWGQAQTRAGAIAGTGLMAAVAPVPALSVPAPQLSPASLSAAPLIPVLVAPAPPTVAAASQGRAAIKPGSEQARAAGAALFDGAGKLSAPAIDDGPFVSELEGDRSRAGGLSPPADAEIIAAYRRASPQSKAVESFGPNFIAMAAKALQEHTFLADDFLKSMKAPQDSRERAIFTANEDLVRAHNAREDAASRRFLQLLGRWYAFWNHAWAAKTAVMKRTGQGGPVSKLPPSPIPNGEYWDMAAGINASGFIYRELDPKMNYSFFDNSPFVASYLNTAAELTGAKNARVLEGDIDKLTKPARPIAVLRVKNVVSYVHGFDEKLEEMADWVAPGGQIVLQNDPHPAQRGILLEKHGPLIRRLIAEGWAIEYGFSGRPGKLVDYGLDTLILTRPQRARKKTPEATARAWKAYEAAVTEIGVDFSELRFLP